MLSAILVIGGLALFFGALLGYASLRFKVEGNPLAAQADAILPQSQCGQCGFPGCKPYAEAVAKGEAAINLCIPGGEPVMQSLAELMGVEPQPVDAEAVEPEPLVAVIDENTCIGCTLCIQACPVDAIVGASKRMHTVIASECTGCKLCLPPCPVDCIIMQPLKVETSNWKWPYPIIPIKPATQTEQVHA
ncbi:MAG: electron transport complex subunit RsxB [Candidatus Thiocaldithrix dubininis]|jgi:electron transport complex protein RnfB|uniref:Ion-translocating oxidoreductase complex subunit B n=1 Tax=Candidatus Thiocaldithrix dubininis TaxID=3080823 RepID=A0AA95HBD5_9GAMM|nr:MAG: electron transport complex subunit RsxB [Candidatus Thiocaldithrix dubininis]